MKRNIWLLSIFPALCIIFLLLAFSLFQDWVKLAISGEKALASIDAIFLEKGDGTAELLNRLEMNLKLTRENGSVVMVEAVDFTIRSIEDDGQRLDLSNGLAAALGGDQSLATDLEELVQDASDRTEWFMLRQSRLIEDTRFVRVEKYENAYFYSGLPDSLEEFSLDESGTVLPVLEGLPEPSKVRTEAIFSYEDAEALKRRKGMHLVTYSRTIDGQEADPVSSDMFIHNEPYATIQFPVYVYSAEGQVFVELADLGKHGDPFLAFQYKAEATALFEPGNPKNVLLVGKATTPEPGEKYLNWFSRMSELYMTRWVYPFVFGLLAIVCGFVGFIFISMITHPAINLPPVPEEKEAG